MYEKCDIKVKRIISRAKKYMWEKLEKVGPIQIEKEILKAYEYAKKAHDGQMRLSGDPYLIHPVEATEILLELTPDLDTIQACLLHDVIEDTPITAGEIEDSFWAWVRFLCEWMEKLWKVRYNWEDRTIWSLRKMFVAMAEDLRVIFIKLSDRVHNMKTLKFHPKKEKRIRIAEETLNIYAPIADRLGLHNIKNILQEECFKILEPKEYKQIKADLRKLSESKKIFKTTARAEIEKLLKWENIEFEMDFRVKSIYSIYKKMKRKNIEDIRDLHDVYGVRIVVDNIWECYRVLWMLHNKWSPLPRRFKDYIALPKPNWYKSLHTTIIWLLRKFSKQPTEIQIRTKQMHKQADIWVAAHFDYKEKGSKISQDINWVKDLKEMTENLEENKEFVKNLKIDVFKNRIFVLSPKWDNFSLPAWSTPIDFAYEIHTDLWNHITLAKVNWKTIPLDKELQNGDIVEIIVDKNKKPNPFWVSFVKTNKAKNRIKFFLNQENHDEFVERWKDILNKYLEKCGLPKLDKELSILKVIEGKENNVEDRNNILEQIWNFGIAPQTIVKKIFKTREKIRKKPLGTRESWEKEKEIIIIWEDENLKYSKCKICKPKIPDKIVAYISHKWEISIHKRDCHIIKEWSKDRYLPAYYKWHKEEKIIFQIKFIFREKLWTLKDLSNIIFNMWFDTLEIQSKSINAFEHKICLKLEHKGSDFLIMERFVERIKIHFKSDLVSTELKEISV